MLSEFKDMLNRTLGRINPVKNWIELTFPDVRSIHLSPYTAWRRARQFEPDEIGKILRRHEIKPDRIEWFVSIVFDAKKDGLLRFFVDFLKLNGVIIKELYSLPKMDESI